MLTSIRIYSNEWTEVDQRSATVIWRLEIKDWLYLPRHALGEDSLERSRPTEQRKSPRSYCIVSHES